jgi:hypothetical protein
VQADALAAGVSAVRARVRLRSLMLAAAVATVAAWPVASSRRTRRDAASDEVGSARLSLDDARRILALAPPQGAKPEREADYWLGASGRRSPSAAARLASRRCGDWSS